VFWRIRFHIWEDSNTLRPQARNLYAHAARGCAPACVLWRLTIASLRVQSPSAGQGRRHATTETGSCALSHWQEATTVAMRRMTVCRCTARVSARKSMTGTSPGIATFCHSLHPAVRLPATEALTFHSRTCHVAWAVSVGFGDVQAMPGCREWRPPRERMDRLTQIGFNKALNTSICIAEIEIHIKNVYVKIHRLI